MGKSYKDATKQPKKTAINKVLRNQYDEEEAESDIKNYVGTSFLAVSKDEEKE
jgi:hypothetical protein